MKRNIMSITTAAALLFATAASAQINLGATTSATVQSATRVSTGGALRSTGAHVQATSTKAVNTTRNVTAKTTSAVAKTVDAAKSTHVQAGANTQTSVQPNSVTVNSNLSGNVGSATQVEAGTQVNSQATTDKVAATKDAVVNTTKETAGKVKSAAGKTNVSASSSTEVSSGH